MITTERGPETFDEEVVRQSGPLVIQQLSFFEEVKAIMPLRPCGVQRSDDKLLSTWPLNPGLLPTGAEVTFTKRKKTSSFV